MVKKAESIQIWEHVRGHARILFQLGVNPVELLLWSRSRKLHQVEFMIEKILRNTEECDFTSAEFRLKTYIADIENNQAKATLEESVNPEVHQSKNTTESEADREEFHCPEQDCKFSTSPKNTESMTDHLSLDEIIKSHMAIKHGVKNFSVSVEVIKLWCGVIED